MPFNLGKFASDWLENTSEAGQDLRELADYVERDTARDLQEFDRQIDQGAQEAERNLTEGRFSSMGARAGAFLSKPLNMVFVAGIIIAIFWGARQ